MEKILRPLESDLLLAMGGKLVHGMHTAEQWLLFVSCIDFETVKGYVRSDNSGNKEG